MKSNLVIQTAFLGDLILSIPVLRRIKRLEPEARLIVLCKQGLGEFLLREKIADEVIEVEKSNSSSYRRAEEALKLFELDHIYCLHRSFRSLLLTAKLKARKKIGFSSMLGFWILDDQIDYAPELPDVIRQFKILETTDEKTREQLNQVDYTYLNVPSENGQLPPVPEFFSFTGSQPVKGTRVAVFPGSVWATKRWTTAGYTELVYLLLKNKYQVDLLGGESEKALCEEIAAACPGARVLAGSTSIAESIENLKSYGLVICNDSAPAHMASYRNIPVIAVFGPTTLSLGFRPWSNRAYVIEDRELECRPCGRHGHEVCPLGHHRCMTGIGAAKVANLAEKILAS